MRFPRLITAGLLVLGTALQPLAGAACPAPVRETCPPRCCGGSPADDDGPAITSSCCCEMVPAPIHEPRPVQPLARSGLELPVPVLAALPCPPPAIEVPSGQPQRVQPERPKAPPRGRHLLFGVQIC